MLVSDNQGRCGKEEDKPNVRPHSAAFSLQSVGGEGPRLFCQAGEFTVLPVQVTRHLLQC